MLFVMAKLIGNAAILLAGCLLMIAGLIAVGIILVGATSIVLVRRLRPSRPALTAGG
jgi:hypothetical protein